MLNQRYRLERLLGRGGMGTVYLAEDVVLERRVAVKVIREALTEPIDIAARFRRESAYRCRFRTSPRRSRVRLGSDRSGRLFLVMELMEGTTLRERLTSAAPLDRPDVLHVLRGVCSAWTRPIPAVSCTDLKPENIFLQRHPSGRSPRSSTSASLRHSAPPVRPDRRRSLQPRAC